MTRYNDLLSERAICHSHQYREGDILLVDNLTVAHRASPEAHLPVASQGLRILHRTTVQGSRHLTPPEKFALPPVLRANPFASLETNATVLPSGEVQAGAWVSGGLGFRWDKGIAMRN
jgi:taurine dioxygenase